LDAIKEIYESYKSKDDKEFNVYMSNPFLTSAEQDVLIEKLRKHFFFDKFCYDAQEGGWYLIHPEEDGNPPSGGMLGALGEAAAVGGCTVAATEEVFPELVVAAESRAAEMLHRVR
jgi:hypothetical protein